MTLEDFLSSAEVPDSTPRDYGQRGYDTFGNPVCLLTTTLDENKSRLRQQTFCTDCLLISALPGLPKLSLCPGPHTESL